jgi:diadenosine tetraphosphate (Ap4A) HIT family hydrolase
MVEVCEFSEEFALYGDLIVATKYWKLFLAPSQRYLGTCVLSLNRECSDLKFLKKEEWEEYSILVKDIEIAIGDIFSPDLFNWSCFKNAAFRDENPKPEVHWHIHPRYKEIAIFDGIEFEDPDFGYVPQPITKKIPENTKNKMKDLIRDKLAISCGELLVDHLE